MQKRDYYDALGVSRSSSEEDIRKAFRKKAMDYHPDRNKSPDAEQKFKEVNEAYQVLTDPEKRSRYDRFGHAGVTADAGGARNFDGFDIFGGFGDIFDSFFGDYAGRGSSSSQRGGDVQVAVNVSFEESVFGVEKEVHVNRVERCNECAGTGSEPGTDTQTCTTCKGMGQVRRTQKSLFGQFSQVTPCPTCRGRGNVIVHPCNSCTGSGSKRHGRKIGVKIPGGIEEGMQVRLTGEGNVGTGGGASGNLYVMVSVEPHKRFRRDGYDLVYELPLNVVQAALGDDVEIVTLSGDVETVKIPPGTQPGAIFKMKGRGVPLINGGSRRGDLVMPVKVEVPTGLDSHQKQLIRELGDTLEKPENGYSKDKGIFDKIKDALG